MHAAAVAQPRPRLPEEPAAGKARAPRDPLKRSAAARGGSTNGAPAKSPDIIWPPLLAAAGFGLCSALHYSSGNTYAATCSAWTAYGCLSLAVIGPVVVQATINGGPLEGPPLTSDSQAGCMHALRLSAIQNGRAGCFSPSSRHGAHSYPVPRCRSRGPHWLHSPVCSLCSTNKHAPPIPRPARLTFAAELAAPWAFPLNIASPTTFFMYHTSVSDADAACPPLALHITTAAVPALPFMAALHVSVPCTLMSLAHMFCVMAAMQGVDETPGLK